MPSIGTALREFCQGLFVADCHKVPALCVLGALAPSARVQNGLHSLLWHWLIFKLTHGSFGADCFCNVHSISSFSKKTARVYLGLRATTICRVPLPKGFQS